MEDAQLSTVMNTVVETHDQVMKLTVTVNSLIARLEAFEKMYASNNVAPKRTIKVAPAASSTDVDDVVSVSSTESKRKQVVVASKAPAPAETNSEEKINSLTFFKKYVMFKNYDNLRIKYSTQAMIDSAKDGIKKPEGTEAYWISIGNAIWKLLDKDQKAEVKKDCIKWKKLNNISGDNTQLSEDLGEEI